VAFSNETYSFIVFHTCIVKQKIIVGRIPVLAFQTTVLRSDLVNSQPSHVLKMHRNEMQGVFGKCSQIDRYRTVWNMPSVQKVVSDRSDRSDRSAHFRTSAAHVDGV
jgi:hypothetical protein